MATACPTCGAANDPEDRFCGDCGAVLSADERDAARYDAGPAQSAGTAAPATERRLVSILFADLVGFTTLADDSDPEAVRDFLGRYFELAREIVDRYGGSVEKFIGDAVMAVWGTPTVREDDAERAVRAALDLVAAVPALGADHPQARAAVLTGEAAAVIGATGQGMVAGDLVNTASRLQAAAPPGVVLVGEATHRAAGDAIAFEPAGEQLLRGKAAPVPAWRAVRVVAGRRGAGRSSRVEPPFVGRDEELQLLKDLLHATTRDGRARLASVVGLAGIGKTRLAWELEKYVDGVAADIYWHRGRSPAYGEGVAFWALGEMVRERARIAESDDAATSREKLAATLREYVADATERAWMEPRLAALLGLEAAPARRAGRVRGRLPDLLRASVGARNRRPRLRGTPVGRPRAPRLHRDDHRPLACPADPRRDPLAPRPPRAAADLGRRPPQLLEPPARSAGTRRGGDAARRARPGPAGLGHRGHRGALRGDPALRGRDGPHAPGPGRPARARRSLPPRRRPRPAGDPGDDGGAARLTARRPDGAGADARSGTRQSSATPSRSARWRPPRATQPSTSDPALNALVRKEILDLDEDPRSPERGQYRFVQGLIREVAYERLAKRDRLARHLAAARYFEELDDPELAGIVTTHYLEAHRLSPEGTERDAIAAKARTTLLDAATRSRDLHAYAGEQRFLEQALAFAPDPADEREILARLAGAAFAAAKELAEFDRAEEYGRRALEATRAAGDPGATARAYTTLASILTSNNHAKEARDILRRAVDELAGRAPDASMVRLEAELGRAYLMADEPGLALPVIEQALMRAEASAELESIAELLVSRAWAVSRAGRPQEGIALLRGAVPLCDEHGFLNARMRCAMNLSAHLVIDDPRQSMADAMAGLEIARRRRLAGWAGSLAGNWADFGLLGRRVERHPRARGRARRRGAAAGRRERQHLDRGLPRPGLPRRRRRGSRHPAARARAAHG